MQFNQPFVYPKHTERPEWVSIRLERFHAQLKKDTELNLKIELLRNKIIDNLEDNILHPSIKIKETLDKKGIGKIIKQIDKYAETDLEFMWYYYLLMQAGFTLSSIIPSSFQPEALSLPSQFTKDKKEAVKKYNDSKKTTEDALTFQKDITKIAGQVKKYFEEKGINIVDLMNSGAKGNVGHIQSLLLSVGLSINSFGEINDVIDNSHVEGLTQTQFFNGSSQAIQALYAKSSETAKPGYLGRKLSTISERIKLSSQKDCGTKKYLAIKIRDKDMLNSFEGRVFKNKLGLDSTITNTSDVIGQTINIRSPLYCKSLDGICAKCYNQEYINNLKLVPGTNIGLLASTGLTGALVNLTLKKSHVGVSLDKEEIDFNKELEKMF